MKIGSFEAKPVAPASTGPTAGDRKAGAASAAAEASAQVELSSHASTLMVSAAADPSFDAAKVERIAGAIREGKFQINPQAIADKLIVNAEELLGRKLS